jgi:signal transduction histidine kinase
MEIEIAADEDKISTMQLTGKNAFKSVRSAGRILSSTRRLRIGEAGFSFRERVRILSIFAILLCTAFGGCQLNDKSVGSGQPFVEFTSVPMAGAGDPKTVSSIKGRVNGAQPGQHVVLYSKGETTWWVQPFAAQPFTEINPDSTWKNATHPGTQYAALLVGPNFNPPATTDLLPSDGVFAVSITRGQAPFWLRWWFVPVYVLLVLLAVFGFYRLRLLQLTKTMNLRFEERLAERMRVAQELHDTLLQGVISASMQLDVAVDHLPPDSPLQPSLRHILQIMSQVIAEGRNTLRGLRTSSDNAHDIELAFLRIPEELASNSKTGYRVLVEGTPVPLKSVIRDEVYSIVREALVNAFRHSGATHIEVELGYTANRLKVLVRDNGCGIRPEVIRKGREGHWGLSGMRERAERIGAKFKVMSGPSAGTEVELNVPGHIVFQVPPSNGRRIWRWKFKPRSTHHEAPDLESEIAK